MIFNHTLLLIAVIALLPPFIAEGSSKPWSETYQPILLSEVGSKLPHLVTYPFYSYPNDGHERIVEKAPTGKILIFGYGSLINKGSARRTIKEEAVNSIEKAIAFGVKRIFNYHTIKPPRWPGNQDPKEKAMLNMVQTFKLDSIANGVLIEVDSEDLAQLVKREVGYDLVPILVASWDEVVNESDELNIKVAYTFVATNELRDHIDYTSTEFYPVRSYLNMIQHSSREFGDDFAIMWDETTYLADGTTKIRDWDQKTFHGILSTDKPDEENQE